MILFEPFYSHHKRRHVDKDEAAKVKNVFKALRRQRCGSSMCFVLSHKFLHLTVKIFSHALVHANKWTVNRILLCDYTISLRPSVHQLLKSLPCVSSLLSNVQSTDATVMGIPVLLQAFKQTRHCHCETWLEIQTFGPCVLSDGLTGCSLALLK